MALLFRPSLPDSSRQPQAHPWTIPLLFVSNILSHLKSLLSLSGYLYSMTSLPRCNLLNQWFEPYFKSSCVSALVPLQRLQLCPFMGEDVVFLCAKMCSLRFGTCVEPHCCRVLLSIKTATFKQQM